MRPGVDTLGGAIEALDVQMFVGRQPEILHMYGPGGVGKSALLQEFGRIATSTGRPVMPIDGREMSATPRGLLRAFGRPTLDATVVMLNRETRWFSSTPSKRSAT